MAFLFFTSRQTGELMRRRWFLRADHGTAIELDATPALVGAARTCALVLEDDLVSLHHAELTALADGVRVRDLGSMNGILDAHGARFGVSVVEHGTEFRIGRSTLQVFAVDASIDAEDDTQARRVVAAGGVETVDDVLAASSKMRELVRRVRMIAPSSSGILFIGAPGSGRATAAQLVHRTSQRRGGPFVVVDAGAPSAEASMFPTQSGDERSVFLRANHGTLFIANIDRLPNALAPRLSAVFERQEVISTELGKKKRVDLRIVASAGAGFDPDRLPDAARRLLRRIAPVILEVSRLDDRTADIAPLAEYFFRIADRSGVPIGQRTLARLRTRSYRGNVDELSSIVARLSMWSNGDLAKHAEDAEGLFAPFLADAMDHFSGDVSRAARAFGIDARTLFSALDRAGIDPDEPAARGLSPISERPERV